MSSSHFSIFKRSKKASLELSINFIVILIISIVVFGFGLFFLRSVGKGASSATEQISRESEMQIQALLDSGEQIIIYPEQLEIKRNKAGTFGVGILNTIPKPSHMFTIGVKCSAYVNKAGEYLDCNSGSPDTDSWTFSSFKEYEVERNENQKISIPIMVGGKASPGTYIFDVYVCYNPNNPSLVPTPCDNTATTYPETGGFLKFRVKVS
jgi:hypothetical protein